MSRSCHRVKFHCRKMPSLKGSGNCTSGGVKGMYVKAHYRPREACARATIARAFLSRKRGSKKVNMGSGKGEKKQSKNKKKSSKKKKAYKA